MRVSKLRGQRLMARAQTRVPEYEQQFIAQRNSHYTQIILEVAHKIDKSSSVLGRV